MKTIIIGKESLLSKHLKINNKNSVIFSSRSTIEINKIIKFINSQKNKINIIMNNFYPSAQIHSISNKNYDRFYEQSILFNAKIFWRYYDLLTMFRYISSFIFNKIFK